MTQHNPKQKGLRCRWTDSHRRRHEENMAKLEAYFERLMKQHDTGGNTPKKLKLPPPSLKWVFLGIFIFYCWMLVDFMLSKWLLGFVYDEWFPAYKDTLGFQLLNVVVMMVIFGLLIMVIRLVFDPGRHQITIFLRWLIAMRKMSKGDFDVKLEDEHSHQLGVLIKNFNLMASSLGQMERMRQEFISNVSHEFQSPLTSISGFARALQNDKLPPETRKHYLDIIELESMRLSRLSDNLLKLTSLESKHHPFEPRTYRLDRQLRRIVLACEPLWHDKQIELDVELPEHMITADEELLDQVWINLLNNSIKFTPQGGTITIRLHHEANQYRIEVSDTGIGIPEAHLPHLFERFYKVDKSRQRSGSGGGSGLGLSIVKKIIEIHHGSITAGNTADGGAIFTVQLPAK
jgi:two-component system, OmpR family, phosphate regulon sensor histidine kinase PhoR